MTQHSPWASTTLIAVLVAVAGCTRGVPPELIPLLSADGRVVDVPAHRLSCPPALYPMVLQGTGYEGRVTLEFVIDVSGRADSSSIQVVAADHPAFVQSARSSVRRCRFTPALIAGQPVRTRVRITYAFTVL